MGQYIVLHMEKRREISPVLERHIFRLEIRYVDGVRTETVWTPDNADPEKANLNEELVSMKSKTPEGKEITLTINQAIRKRLKEVGIEKVRKNQNTAIEIILSGSPDTMNNLSEKDLKNWVKDSMDWAGKKWGKDNIVSAVLHRDEKTPHIHIILVPLVTGQSRRTASKERKLSQQSITKKKYNVNNERLRLSANEVYTQPRLYSYHTSYAKEVGEKYALQRGILAEAGSKKKHQTSEEYNRQLERERIEQQELIDTLKSDCSEKEENLKQIKADIEIAQGALNNANQNRRNAEAKKIQAEKDAAIKESQINELENKSSFLSMEITTKEKRMSELQGKIDNNVKIINKQESDYNTRKKEIENQKTELENQKSTIEDLSSELTTLTEKVQEQQDIITTQETTIETNKKNIKDQERTISARKEVDEDAIDKRIESKRNQLNNLNDEFDNVQKELLKLKDETLTVYAKNQKYRAEMRKSIQLKTPQKGTLGYKTADVEAFINSVEKASLIKAMNDTPSPIDVEEKTTKELSELRDIQNKYNKLLRSPELLRKQLLWLEQEQKRESIKNTIEYVTQKKVQILSFSVENSSRGEEIYTNFRFENDDVIKKGVIRANEKLIYTDRDFVNSYQTANEHSKDKIWKIFKPVAEIRQERYDQEIMSRYATKLSNKFNEQIKIISYDSMDNEYVFLSEQGVAYYIDKTNNVFVTSDRRVKNVKDCHTYSQESIWSNEGDINTFKKYTRGI